jgi:hypothetical protein
MDTKPTPTEQAARKAAKDRAYAHLYSNPGPELDEELLDGATLDPKLSALLKEAAADFERTGRVSWLKEQRIRKRLAVVKRRLRNAHQ